jgi:hypothetical protein
MDNSIEELSDEPSEITDSSITENSDILENTTFITELDELTLSLLMNKTQYRKYITQTDPAKNEVNRRFIKDNHLYRSKILEITARMLDTPDVQITTDVDKIFVAYTKTLVQYFQMKELEQQTKHNNGYCDSTDDTYDSLFDSIEETTSGQSPTSSFWGKERVVKQGKPTISGCDMRMFSKR